MDVRVKDLVGRNCITFEDGQLVYELIRPELLDSNPVSVDFSGVEVFASPFFNASVGQLLRDVAPDTLRELLAFSGLAPNGDEVLRRVVENAKSYWADQGIRARVEAALSEQAKTA
jgi:hypothetical protein